LLLLIVVPALAWAVVRPVRVLAPGLAPVSCANGICVDVPERAPEAVRLVQDSRSFVVARVGSLPEGATMIFCATQRCADHFGLGLRSAVTLGSAGTVIGPRAWKPYYVRHELIHQAQARHIGVVRLLWTPAWIVEGMAYGLSDDPRAPLSEPFESQRRRFLAWYAGIPPGTLWTALRDR
jgi:hypothetical protein